jgi:hypothetical protein
MKRKGMGGGVVVPDVNVWAREKARQDGRNPLAYHGPRPV